MENRKEYCKNILEKWRELKEKDELLKFSVDVKGMTTRSPHPLTREELEEFDMVRSKLRSCMGLFSTDELIELSTDEKLKSAAEEILEKRV